MLLAGCVTVAPSRPHANVRAQPVYQVKVDTDTGWGQGVLIEPDLVATVAHVVSGVKHIRVRRGLESRRAVVEEKLWGLGSEKVVLLRLDEPLEGPVPELQQVRPGDSGSACIGQDGQLIGLVTGTRTQLRDGKIEVIINVTPINPAAQALNK